MTQINGPVNLADAAERKVQPEKEWLKKADSQQLTACDLAEGMAIVMENIQQKIFASEYEFLKRLLGESIVNVEKLENEISLLKETLSAHALHEHDLKNALLGHALEEEVEFHSDGGFVSTGYRCLLCKAHGRTSLEIKHEENCLLS